MDKMGLGFRCFDAVNHSLEGVDTLYQVAAVYKHWAKNPETDIIQPNLDGTMNILEVAARCKVKKIIYVSSITALDRRQLHMDATGWNQNPGNPYYQSNTESEQLALRLAQKHNLFLVSVLPAAMIGPHCNGRLTPTMKILESILNNEPSKLTNAVVRNVYGAVKELDETVTSTSIFCPEPKQDPVKRVA